MLQEQWSRGLSLEEAETLALSTLKEVMEEKISDTNVEIASVTYSADRKTGVFKGQGIVLFFFYRALTCLLSSLAVYTKAQLAPIVARLPAASVQ